jgi:hypothetical protein
MEPTLALPVFSLLALVSIEYGGYALLRFLTSGGGGLGAFREQFFRAGHAHAGVLQVLSLVYFVYLERTDYSSAVQWLAGGLLVVGVLSQSGGFFLHLWRGQPGQRSVGTQVTAAGAVLIAAALITLAVGLIRAG